MPIGLGSAGVQHFHRRRQHQTMLTGSGARMVRAAMVCARTQAFRAMALRWRPSRPLRNSSISPTRPTAQSARASSPGSAGTTYLGRRHSGIIATPSTPSSRLELQRAARLMPTGLGSATAARCRSHCRRSRHRRRRTLQCRRGAALRWQRLLEGFRLPISVVSSASRTAHVTTDTERIRVR